MDFTYFTVVFGRFSYRYTVYQLQTNLDKFEESFIYNDISLLADLMGHERIETPRIYLRQTASEQQEIVDNCYLVSTNPVDFDGVDVYLGIEHKNLATLYFTKPYKQSFMN